MATNKELLDSYPTFDEEGNRLDKEIRKTTKPAVQSVDGTTTPKKAPAKQLKQD